MNRHAVRPRPPRGAAPPGHGALYLGSEEYSVVARRMYEEEREVVRMLGQPPPVLDGVCASLTYLECVRE